MRQFEWKQLYLQKVTLLTTVKSLFWLIFDSYVKNAKVSVCTLYELMCSLPKWKMHFYFGLPLTENHSYQFLSYDGM